MTEKELIVKFDDAFVTGMIDLFFQDSDGEWVLIDYKTGAVEDSKGSYVFQLGLYAAMLKRAFPDESIATAGLYVLDRNELVRINLPSDMEDAESKVRTALRGISETSFQRHTDAPCRACSYRYLCTDNGE